MIKVESSFSLGCFWGPTYLSQTRGRAHSRPFRVLRSQQQRPRCLVQPDDAEDVGREMPLQVRGLEVCDFWPGVRDAGVGDHDVQVVDALLGGELFHGLEGVALDRGVGLDHDEPATWAGGEVGQGAGGGVSRIAVRGYDDVVGLCEVDLEKAFS